VACGVELVVLPHLVDQGSRPHDSGGTNKNQEGVATRLRLFGLAHQAGQLGAPLVGLGRSAAEASGAEPLVFGRIR
jgi:hypothetical protein